MALILVMCSVFLDACAHPAASFRLVRTPASLVIVPPRVKDASVQQSSIRLAANVAASPCVAGSGLHVAGKTLVVSRAIVAAATADDVDRWAACFDSSLVDAVPLDLSKRRALVTTSALKGFSSLRVVSPVFRAGVDPASPVVMDEPAEVTGTSASITIGLKSNPDLTGYEVAWYDVQPRSDGPGLRIVPRGAEVHVNGEVENKPAPAVNRFDFSTDARWFRYFVMTRVTSEKNDHNIVLIGASSATQLEGRTAAFRKDATGYLQSAEPKSYAALSGAFGVNPYIRIKVNGEERDVSPGATVGQVIDRSHLANLKIIKPYRGKMAPVQWDRTNEDVLSLPLEGGEELSW